MQLVVSRIHSEHFSKVYSCLPGLPHCNELWALLGEQLLLSCWLPSHQLCHTSLCQGVSLPGWLAQWLSYLPLQSVAKINYLWQATSPSPLSSFKGEAALSLVVKHIPAVLHMEMLVGNAKSVFVWMPLQLCICEFEYLGWWAVSVPAVCLLLTAQPACLRGHEVLPREAEAALPAPQVWAFWTGATTDLCNRFDWPNTSQESSPLVAAIV